MASEISLPKVDSLSVVEAAAAVLLITILTVGFHTIKTALANPVIAA